MQEKEIGKAAASMVKTALQEKIRNSGLHLSDKKKNSLVKATGAPRMSKIYPGELYGIAVKMPKHGFILNFGATTQRRTGIVKRETPRTTFYKRKAHPFHLEPRSFIDDAITESGAVDYLSEKIGEIRAEAVVNQIGKAFSHE